MWVKICGNTNLEDALLAAELGADALGFVFASSVRQVNTNEVARIVSRLPTTVQSVGVFQERSARWIVTAVRETGLNAVQLHGTFDADVVAELVRELGKSVSILQAVHWTIGDAAASKASVAHELERIASRREMVRVLMDARMGGSSGGMGVAFDWQAAQDLFRQHPGMILAGGLTPENVVRAVETLQPWGLDVASGVEALPGRKDPKKLRTFLERVRSCTLPAI